MEEGRPTGTVTFLFTDVVGSSALWEEHRAAMAAALARHDDIVRNVVGEYGGYVFSTAGDAFSVAFAEPVAAVRAALAVQGALAAEPWPSLLSIAVRIGLHTGTAEERGGDYFGPTLNRAARIMGLAGAGEVIASAATAELARELERDGAELVPLGSVELRGVGPERMVGVVPPGGTAAFADVRSAASSARVHLPSLATSFVGRELEVVELASALRGSRLVTLVGPGGVGKTRLAIETGWTMAEEFPDGVWLVELAPVRDRDAVVHTFVLSLGIRPLPGLSPSEALLVGLRGERRLVIVDNSEHLVDEVAAVARLIVERSPTVTLLATSRLALGVPGERVWPVAPLSPSGAGAALFHDRAAAAGTVGLEGADAAIETLCARLDGMPLAIELAAARARAMTPAEMLARLDDRFRLLRAPRPDVDPRHATLQATLEWSYQLLDERAQAILDRLGVFAGPVELADVVAVAADVDELDIVDALTTLVDHSLVVAEQTAGTTRYRLLDTMRAFARRRLADTGALARFVRAHAEWAVERAQALNDALLAPDERVAMDAVDEMDRFWPDLRAAVTGAIGAADVALVARLLGGFSSEAMFREREEVAGWMDLALDLPGILDQTHMSNIMGVATQLAWRAGRFEVMERRIILARQLRAQGVTDPRLSIAAAEVNYLMVTGHVDEALTPMEEALAHHYTNDARVYEVGFGVIVTAVGECYAGGPMRALARLDALPPLENPILRCMQGWARTMVLLELDPGAAIETGQAAIELARASRVSWMVDSISNYLTAALARAGDPTEALALMRSVLVHASAGGGVQSLANTVRNAIVLFTRLGRTEPAALISGWLDAKPFALPGTVTMRAHAAEAVSQVATHLGAADFDRLRAQGAATSTADLVTLLLGVLHEADARVEVISDD